MSITHNTDSIMTDESIMPWGIHQGKKMANVPSYYLKWLVDSNNCSGAVERYIKNNWDCIINDISND